MILLSRLSWLISLAISLMGFLLVGSMFTTNSDGTSGSGDIGFVGMIFLFPFLLLSLFITYRYVLISTRKTTNSLYKIVGIIGGLFLISFSIYFFNEYKNDVLQTLNGYTTNENPSLFDLPKLNENTYTIYFNFYTFLFIHSVFGFIGALIGMVKQEAKKEELLD